MSRKPCRKGQHPWRNVFLYGLLVGLNGLFAFITGGGVLIFFERAGYEGWFPSALFAVIILSWGVGGGSWLDRRYKNKLAPFHVRE
jgi:hypothetical protein